MKKVCFVTATRAEYGLLKGVISLLSNSNRVQEQVVVTGTHLSPNHGHTIDEIINDGIKIDGTVDMLMSSNEPSAIAKSMGICSILISDLYSRLQPDLLVVLGDRYELLSICSSALVMRIPIAHIGGGDITEGAIDDQVRNAISMLADLHFPGNDESAKRIEKMRGSKEYIYNVGEPGLDSIVAQDIVNRTTLSSDLGLDLDKPWYLITIHPETMKDKNYNLNLASNIIKALKQISNSQFVITSANADLYGNEINNYLKKIAQENSESFFFIYSLGHKKYISMINQVVCLIGNSSSGIVEAPILGKPVINIGGRQKGRHLCHNIINASNDAESILTAIKKIHGKYSPDYYYGDGHTCEKIADYILKFLYR